MDWRQEGSKIQQIARGQVVVGEPMASHTSFRIGGPADIFFEPAGIPDLCTVLQYARSIRMPVFVLGNGTNLLVADSGIEGLVVHMHEGLDEIRIGDLRIHSGAAVKIGKLLRVVVDRGLEGLEFLAAVPGTVGGAVFMNAGTYLGSVSDSLVEAEILDENSRFRRLARGEIPFRYRHSGLGEGWIVLGATFQLRQGDPSAVRQKVLDMFAKRRKEQPLSIPNAGSIFKNPPGHSAWRCVEAAGGRGLQMGNVRVSERHSNFIVNKGDGKAADVLGLIRRIQQLVGDKLGIQLEPEIRIVGRWDPDGNPNRVADLGI
ncbi:MAG: UDP-N-acetylmuramate dehydrogenase [Armatimonadetes bacterium]|nr:UDP-N-acetylmuramate dehydrogenase [Armatimonadota bacterium]